MSLGVTREDERKILEENDLFYEVFKIAYHYFPTLFEMLGEVTDPRNPSYVKYTAKTLLITRIVMSILLSGSMRSGTSALNSSAAIKALGLLCGEELKNAPHYDTINDFLSKCKPDEFQDILIFMAKSWSARKLWIRSRSTAGMSRF
jgi:hypothetical protein